MLKNVLQFLCFWKKRIVLTNIVQSFHQMKSDLKALQEQNKTDIAKHDQELAKIAAKQALLQEEHDAAVVIHDNIANNILGK